MFDFQQVTVDVNDSVQQLGAAQSGKTCRLAALVGAIDQAGRIWLEDTSGTVVMGPIPLQASGDAEPAQFQYLPDPATPDLFPASQQGRGLQIRCDRHFTGFAKILYL